MTTSPRSAGRRPPRRLDLAVAAEVRPRQRTGAVPDELRRRALEDDVPAVLAGARSEVDDVVGGANRLFVVLDDDDSVAEISQPAERREQARDCRAGGVRSTARPERTSTPVRLRPDLRGEPDALALRRPTASRRCARA